MNFTEYLTMSNPGFGPLAWVFLIVQIVAVIGGLYLALGHTDTNAVRGERLKQLGTALAVLGGIGALIAVLRLSSLVTPRYPTYLVALVEAGVLAYALYYWRAVYPKEARRAPSKVRRSVTEPVIRQQQRRPTQQQAARQQARPQQPTQQARRTEPSSAPTPVQVQEPRVASGRRDARRERKRRKG